MGLQEYPELVDIFAYFQSVMPALERCNQTQTAVEAKGEQMS